MATLTHIQKYREILNQIITQYCDFLGNHNETNLRFIISQDQTRYLVIDEGWQGMKRIHALIFDAEIRNRKIWLHHDGLDHGIAEDLVAAGIPKDCIVLAFHPPHIREHTGYGVD